MGRKIWSIGVGVALVLAACGTEIPQSSPVSFTDTTTPAEVSVTSGITDTSGQTTTTVAPRSDSPLFVECSGIDLGQFPFEPERLLPYDGDVAALVDDDAADEFGPMFGTGTEWFVGSDTEEELSLLTPAEPDELGRLRYGHAVFERRADGLQLTGFGSGCVVEATLEGYGIAELSLPLGIVQHVPDATLFSILATERSCAGGQSPQEVLTFVTETTDRVEIVVLVESPPGFQDCPSNPAFELRIEIDEPLGTRTLIDAGFAPGVMLTGRDGDIVTDTTLGDQQVIDHRHQSARPKGPCSSGERLSGCLRDEGIATGARYVADSEISLGAVPTRTIRTLC